MKVYTYSEARQNLATLLDRAAQEGTVHIKRRDGQEFIITPARSRRSALDIQGVHLDLTAADIVRVVREGRERESASLKLHGARRKTSRR